MDKRLVSRRIAKSIMNDLLDRRGIRQAIEECDNDVLNEIRQTMEQIVIENLDQETFVEVKP